MTFDDDFCKMELENGQRMFTCKQLGYTWPPPADIVWGGFHFVRVSYSQITDEQRGEMTHVCRGALYRPKKEES